MFGSEQDTLVNGPVRQVAAQDPTRTRPGADGAGLETRQWRPADPHQPRPQAQPAIAQLVDPAIARLIQTHIVPRLVLTHAAVMSEAALGPAAGLLPGPAEVAALTALVLEQDLAGATAFVETMRRDGTTPEQIYLELLAPAARLLGVFWQDDSCDFTQVTLGLVHLQTLMRALGPAFHADAAGQDRDSIGGNRQILLCPLPGQQHGFGLSMVAEFFRRAGWCVSFGLDGAVADVAAAVRHDWFAVVGFSASCDADLAALPGTIRNVRRASRNPRVGILVGGPVFIDHPEYAAAVGADATAVDAPQAIQQAERLLALRARHD